MSRIAIVGDAVAGLSAGAALATDGHEVLLFESESHLGYHASGRSAAIFEENYGNEVVHRLNRASGPTLEKMGVLSPRKVMLVARNIDTELFWNSMTNTGMRQITLGEAKAQVPILSADIAFAEVSDRAMDIDTGPWSLEKTPLPPVSFG
ncbi:MAG: FAD-dependent oxidoreductase [Pseudomonadota bacterium]